MIILYKAFMLRCTQLRVFVVVQFKVKPRWLWGLQ